ncbi:uncharacterized protein [Apostichopus japonicus]|uniref:uncharacterized protein n=1 Tax=Stichopus japonicus TaxID=307972 RepID=UPI003AB49A20
MDQQPSGPQTRSMKRQNSSTVEHVTNRLDRVSTEEVKKDPVVNISPPRKHKLSTSKDPSSKKKIRQQSRNEQDVRKITRAVLKIILEVQDSSKKTPRRKRSRQQGISPPLACNFNEATTATKTVEKSETSGPSSLDFGGAIEPDGSDLSAGDGPIEADGGNANTSDDGQQGKSSMDPKVVKEAAANLRNIGDKANKEAKQLVLEAALKIVKEGSYKKYKECLTILIDDSQAQICDGSERSVVAVVCLLTQMVVTKAKDAMVSDATVDEVVEAATEYIVENHPTWV